MVVAERLDKVIETQREGSAIYWGTQSIFHRGLRTYSAQYEIVETEDGWTVADRETGIFGAGPDESSAFRDFVDAVLEHRDVLERQPALSEALETQLGYLRRLIG